MLPLARESKLALVSLLLRFPVGRLGWSRFPRTLQALLWITLDRRGVDPEIPLARWRGSELRSGRGGFAIRPSGRTS